jgi:hypothetical protein
MSYFEIFKRRIIENSEADNYKDACAEWVVVGVDYDSSDESECICTHHIRQVITIKNRHNNKQVDVGSDCIEKIEGLPNTEIYKGAISNLKELKNSCDATIGSDLIQYIRLSNIIEERHIKFLEQMRCKRQLSAKQAEYYSGLQRKVLRLLGSK